MHLKDYYSILELPPSATLDEIKKAYRRLALLHHPDKKGDDPYAAAHFTEIKEAYETLTQPAKKDYYLQQRWYAQSMGKRTTQPIITPISVLKQLLELDKYSSKLDIHRMDKDGLYEYLVSILSDENIQKLNSFNEDDINKEIIISTLRTAQLLQYAPSHELAIRLQKIKCAGTDASTRIEQFIQQRKQTAYWEKRKIWIVVIVVVILCVSIFLTAGR